MGLVVAGRGFWCFRLDSGGQLVRREGGMYRIPFWIGMQVLVDLVRCRWMWMWRKVENEMK